ncbi:MAG: OsmC family protein, partial [Bryobacteraceae bacterium]
GYRAYSRDHEILVPGKSGPLPGSSDPAFRGDPARYSPEELLLASLSACHMLWFLHLCADAGIVVTAYSDAATAEMTEHLDGSGEFAEATLHPAVVIADEKRLPELPGLHDKAHAVCFIARSVNFPVRHQPAASS